MIMKTIFKNFARILTRGSPGGIAITYRHYSDLKTMKSNTVRNRKSSKAKHKSSDKCLVPVATPGTINSNFGLMVPVFSRLTQLSEAEIQEYFDKTVQVHNKFITELGVEFGTKHFKSIALYCILLVEERNPPPVDRVGVGKVDKWPNVFGYLRPVFHSITPNRKGQVLDSKEICVEKLRLLHTLFKLNRICSSYANLDVSNLKKTFQLPQEFVSKYESYLENKYGDTKPIEVEKFKINGFLGSKKGPNNVPKLDSAGAEAAKLLLSKEHHHFKKLCDLTDNSAFYEYFLQTAKKFVDDHPNEDLNKIRLRKLVAIPDTGNKSRTVAICDVWTQMVLEPFEDYLKNEMLKEFPSSSAYLSHAGGFEKLKLNCLEKEHLTIDASDWTDNFPSHIQYLTVKKRLGEDYAASWQALAIKCRWHLGNSEDTVVYGKGQGMGTKGSFMAASYSDHNVIEFTYLDHYKKILDYQKVGDDLAVQDPDNIFEKMYASIGVPINVSKSKRSTPRGHFLEFVSRNLWDGLDCSILSPNVLTKALKQPYIYPVLTSHLAERIPEYAIPSLEEVFLHTKPGRDVIKFEEHKRSVKELISIYAALSGDRLIKVENPEKFEGTRELLLAIIQEILRLHKRSQVVDPTDSISLFEDRVSEFINNEYDDKWRYFLDADLSLKEIEQFNFSLRVFTMMKEISEASYTEGNILRNPREPHPMRYTISDVRPTYRLSVTRLLLECLMVVKCKLENIRIINSFDSLNPKNPDPKIHLLKSLSKALFNSRSEKFDEELNLKDKFMLSTLNLNVIYSEILKSER